MAENAAPHSFRVDRQDAAIRTFEHFLVAGLEGLQLAGASECAFWEDADQVPILDAFSTFLQRSSYRLGVGCHQDGTKLVSQSLEQRIREIASVNYESDVAWQHPQQQQPIDP